MALETIGQIEIEEGLPYPEINGEWGKIARTASASYLIVDFTENNLDEAIELTKKTGLKYLYHGGPFENWGHFDLQKEAFPDNWESMKRCVEKAKKHGIYLGVHILSNFITTNDPYVSPIPDKRLAEVGASVLTKDIEEKVKEIFIEDPTFFNQMENNSLHAVVVGGEIIRYAEVSDNEPWKLIDCARGAFGTTASAHKKGDEIGKLMDHPYKTFLTNNELSEEMAKTIARLFNETGLRQISFDGLEGNWSTGMGQYGRQRFVKIWYDNLKPELQGKIINDASNPGHYFWHIYTRMNWGEPWYAGFRESQTQYRLNNQRLFRRNFMPGMLGWFRMTNETSLEDIEWLLARAAGFDAGFALVTDPKTVRENGLGEKILSIINEWETARMSEVFSPEQKKEFEEIRNEYHLEKVEEGKWKFYPIENQIYTHDKKEKQPGEPVFSTFIYENPYDKQNMQFIITVGGDCEISNLNIELDNYESITIPFTLKNRQILKYTGGNEFIIYDKNWNIISVEKTKQLLISNGEHSVKFDCKFSGGEKPVVKLEIKTIGEPTLITIK